MNFAVTARDTCGRIPPSVTCEPPSGSLFPVGVTVVVCTATTSEATNRCAFSVYVRDETPPILSCPDPIEVEAEGLDGAIVRFEVSASDECSANLMVYCYPPSGSVFPVGTTRVLCMTRDEGGNEASCILPITVRPPKPMIAVRSNAPPGRVRLQWTHKAILQQTDSLSAPRWQNVGDTIEQSGAERRIDVSVQPAQRFFRLIPDPLAPPPDEDRDGVRDADDLCPETPSGLAVDACGCSPVQIVQRPNAVLDPTMALLRRALDDLEREPAFDSARGTLANLLALLEGDADFMKRGEIESAANRYSDRVIALAELEADLERNRPRFERAPIGPGDEADFDDADEKNLFIDYLIRQVTKGRRAALVTEACFNHTREELDRTVTLTGRVAELTESGNRARLESGENLFFAEGYGGPDSLSHGASIRLAGVRFKDGSTVVTELQSVDADEVLTAKKISPIQLAIAPVQLFSPTGPWTLHHPLAYRQGSMPQGGLLFLEEGMRFATRANPVPSPGTLYHALRLKLTYKATSGLTKQATLANALKVGDKPVKLPADMRLGTQATLSVSKMHFPTPTGVRNSAKPEVLEVETYGLYLRPRYSYFKASYSTAVFDLEDSPVGTAHGVTQVTEVEEGSGLVPAFIFQPKTFLAEGYRANGGTTSYPTPQLVGQNTPFAVFAYDFFNPELPAMSEALAGTTNAGGLRWPRVTGNNNGFTYSFSCGLPRLVRDRIAICNDVIANATLCEGALQECDPNDATETYYKLPFTGGWPTWTMSQGNCGCFTHNGDSQHAYDMPAPAGTVIRAARGGRVAFVRQDEWRNCCPDGTGDSCMDPCPFSANVVVIEHQDGTVGRYVHLPQNGASVVEEQIVRRGDPIGLVGNTGFSTGPHLHFVVASRMGEPSIPSRFQAWSVQSAGGFHAPVAPVRNCYRPFRGEILFSTNKAWYE